MPPKEQQQQPAAGGESCSVTVVVRIRPFNKREKEAKSLSCLDFPSGANSIRIFPFYKDKDGNDVADYNRGRNFAFDHCYKASISQKQVFLDVGVPVVSSAFAGFNCCIFAYGQTGSGKSFSMLGPANAAHVLPPSRSTADENDNNENSNGNDAEEEGEGENNAVNPHESAEETGLTALRGIIPRLAERIFQEIESRTVEYNKTKKETDGPIMFDISLQYLEIYQEKVRDLLDKSKKKDNLKVRVHPTQGVFVEDLTTKTVRQFSDVMHLLNEGNDQRQVAATNMNERSSRSHAVFSIILRQTWSSKQTREDDGSEVESVSERRSQINLVDLAGSERAKSTGAEGATLKEGALINKSLTTLGLVISGLADQAKGNMPGGKEPFIPYRDSALTFLLKENLGGNSKTFMISALSPASINFEETLSTLRYADRAKAIVTKAVINEDAKDRAIRELKAEIEKYQKELGELQKLRELVATQQLAKEKRTEESSAQQENENGEEAQNQQNQQPQNQQQQQAPASPTLDSTKTTAEAFAARERLEIAESLIRHYEQEEQAAKSYVLDPSIIRNNNNNNFLQLPGQNNGGATPTNAGSATASPRLSSTTTAAAANGEPYLMNVEGAGNWAVMPLRFATATFFGKADNLEQALASLKQDTEDYQRVEEITNTVLNGNTNNRFYVQINHAGVCPLHCCLTVEKCFDNENADQNNDINNNNNNFSFETKASLRPFNAPKQFEDEENENADEGGEKEAWTFINADVTVYEDTLLHHGQTFQLGSEYVSVKFVDPAEAARDEEKKKQESKLLTGSKLRARGKTTAMNNNTARLNNTTNNTNNNNLNETSASHNITMSMSSTMNLPPLSNRGGGDQNNYDDTNNFNNNNNNDDQQEESNQNHDQESSSPEALPQTGNSFAGINIPKISISQKRQMGPGLSIQAQKVGVAATTSNNNNNAHSDLDSDEDPDLAGSPQQQHHDEQNRNQNDQDDDITRNKNGDRSPLAIKKISGFDQHKQSQINNAFLGDHRKRGPLAMTPRSSGAPKIQDPDAPSRSSSPLMNGPTNNNNNNNNQQQQLQQQQKVVDEVVCIYKHTFLLLGDIGTGKTAFRNVLGKDFGFFERIGSKSAPVTTPTMGYDVNVMPQSGGSTKADLTFFELSGRLQSMFAPLQVMIPDRRITFMLFFKLTDRVDVQYFKPYIEIMQRASPHNSTNLILVGTHRDEVVLDRGNGRESLATDEEIRQVMTEIQMEFSDYARAFEPDETRRPRVAARYALSLKDRTALCTVVNAPVMRPDGTVMEAIVVEQSQKKMSELLNAMADHAVKVCRTDATFSQGLIPTRLHRLYQEIFQERTRGKFMIEAADYKALAQRVDRRYADRGNTDDLHKHTSLLHSWLTLHHHHRHATLKRSVIIDPMSVFRVIVVYCVAMAAARTMCFYRPPAVPPPAGSVRAAAETLLNHFGVDNLPFSIPIVRAKDGLITSADDDPFRGEGISIFLTLGGGIVSMPVAKELFQQIARERGISVQAALNILCRFDLLLHADKVAVFLPNPDGVAENGLLGSLVSLQQAAEEQRGVNAHECSEEIIASMKFFVAPLMFSRPASEALTLYVPSLLRWSGARTSRFSLNNVPYNLMGRLVCRLAHIADGVYVGPLPEVARNYTGLPQDGGAPHSTILPADQRPFWNDATWLISGYTARVLVRLVSRSLFIFFLDLDTVLTCRESEKYVGEAPEEEENCLPVAWMTSDAALNGINGGPLRFIADDQRESFADYIAQRCDAIWETPSSVQEDVLAAVRSVLHETPGVVFREYEQQRVEDDGMTDLARAPATARGSSGWVLKGQEGCGTARGPAPAMAQVGSPQQQQGHGPSDKKSAAALAAAAAVLRAGQPQQQVVTGEDGSSSQTAYDSSGEVTELDGTCSTRFSLDADRVQRMLSNSVLLHDGEEIQLSVSLKIASVARNRLRLLEELWYLRHFAEGVEELPPPSQAWYEQWYELARGALSDESAAMDALVDCLSAVRS